MTTDLALKRNLLSTPGDTIQEYLDKVGMSQKELAERMGRTPEKLNELIRGKQPITEETATKLEYVLGVPASFWLNLERQYQDELLQIRKMEFLEECKDWLTGFPLPALKKLNIIPDTRDKETLIESLLKFFRVASPANWDAIYMGKKNLAFKIDLKASNEPKAIAAWLRYGEIQAESLKIGQFDKKKITESLPILKEICFQGKRDFLEQLQNECSKFGVALVFTPCISKAPIYGASRWIKSGTLPLIQLTDRQKDYNAFWFTFYHELTHIRNHPKSETFISSRDSEIVQEQEKEAEADRFAAGSLISNAQWTIIKQNKVFTPSVIKELSNKLSIHPSILVSQLQRQNLVSYKDYALNHLKTQVKFEELQFG